MNTTVRAWPKPDTPSPARWVRRSAGASTPARDPGSRGRRFQHPHPYLGGTT